MGKYELIKEDYEIIQKLLDISMNIKTKYDELFCLEQNNQKESHVYIETFKLLNSLLDSEKDIYQLFFNNPDRIQSLMEYFSPKYKLNNLFDEIRTMVDGNTDELIKKRIVIRLLNIKLGIEQQRLYDMGKEVSEELDEININFSNQQNFAYYGLANLLQLNNELKEDYLKSLIALANVDDNNIRINIDYLISFLYESCESELLKNQLSFNGNLYWASKLTADMKGISDSTYEEAKENFGYNMVLEIIDYLSKTHKSEIWNLLVRVSLLFCNDNERSELEKQFPTFMQELLVKYKSDANLMLVISLKG